MLKISPDGNLSFRLSGQSEWKTSGPFVVLHYYDRQHPRAQVVSAPSGDETRYGTAGTPSLSCKGHLSLREVHEGEYLVRAEFPNISVQLEFNVKMSNQGEGFSVRIDDNGVTEGMPRLFRILGIEILPNFGAARTGERGYLTLPNWSGCQTFFDKSYPREVRQTIYSSNDQWEYNCNMSVFGVTREQGTLCGYVATGDFDAQLFCRVHWEQEQTNSVHPYLVYRWEQQDDRITGPREVRYAFAPSNDEGGEGYVFCGKTYREFLRKERGLISWEEKAKTRPVVLDYRDRFFLKIFQAYKDPQADGHGAYHATCTFAQAQEILEDCLKRGMRKLAVMLVGWGQDGHDGMPPTRFPVDERLGGEAELKRLIAWCRDNDIILGVHDSYGGYYTSSPEFNTEDLICHRSGEYWESIIWSGGQSHIACPKVYIEKQVKRDIPAVRKLGIYGHHHIDAVGTFMTCYSEDHPLKSRTDFVKEVHKMFQIAIDEIGSVSTEYPFGPYFNTVDGYFHSYTKPGAWHRACPVGRYFLDRTIPLVMIVLHGSSNCQESVASCHDQPLRWLSWGLTPEWEVCKTASESFGIPAYSKVADTMMAVYDRYYGGENIISTLNPLWIEGHWEEADGVTRTRYSDGTVVRVNEGQTAYEDLPPQSYKVETK